MSTVNYLHGFDEIEQKRLVSQAAVLEAPVFEKIDFGTPEHLLEIGCGVGAQTELLIKRYPNTKITGIELSEVQLDTARHYLASKNYPKERYELHQMDAMQMRFEDNSFDAVYICWVLEHINNSVGLLKEAYRVLKPNGIIYITEVQNNHLFLHPLSPFLMDYWRKYNRLQLAYKGDPYVGAKLGHFLNQTHFEEIDVYPQMMLCDSRTPERRTIMLNYWRDLMLSGFNGLLEADKVKAEDKQRIVEAYDQLLKNPDSIFMYTCMQGRAVKQ